MHRPVFFALLAASASLAFADKIPLPLYGPPPVPVYPIVPPPKYSFEYAVHDDRTNNHFGHSENRDGDRTDGKYFVHLPDGRVQTVTYYADETGYYPDVQYKGTAIHPTKAPYYPPKPVYPLPPYHPPVHA